MQVPTADRRLRIPSHQSLRCPRTKANLTISPRTIQKTTENQRPDWLNANLGAWVAVCVKSIATGDQVVITDVQNLLTHDELVYKKITLSCG